MRRTPLLVVLGALSLVSVAGLLVANATPGGSPRSLTVTARAGSTTGGPVRVGSLGVNQPGHAKPLRSPEVPERARAVATIYAVDAFGVVAGQTTDAWVRLVGPFCTAAWRSHIGDAQSGVSLAKTTVRPIVLATFGSWAPAGAVGVTVVLASSGTTESLYVELRLSDGRYVVEAAQ
jgi:hypothetical protein